MMFEPARALVCGLRTRDIRAARRPSLAEFARRFQREAHRSGLRVLDALRSRPPGAAVSPAELRPANLPFGSCSLSRLGNTFFPGPNRATDESSGHVPADWS